MTTTTHHLPSLVRTRVIPKNGRAEGIEQVGWLTPYSAETIAQSALRAGPGARLDVIVPKGASAPTLAAVEAVFAWLIAKGVVVTVQRDTEDEG